MNNYYTECIKDIQTLIQSQDYEAALKKLHVELSMPYIPNEHKEVFESLLHEVRLQTSNPSKLFTDIYEVKDALQKGELMVAKALNSLEAMNLRPVIDEVKEILQLDLDDLVKRFILIICVEQELIFEINMILENQDILINVATLISPYRTQEYVEIYTQLVASLESHDPSFLSLCLDELNIQTMNAFPRVNTDLTKDTIISNVENYLSMETTESY